MASPSPLELPLDLPQVEGVDTRTEAPRRIVNGVRVPSAGDVARRSRESRWGSTNLRRQVCSVATPCVASPEFGLPRLTAANGTPHRSGQVKTVNAARDGRNILRQYRASPLYIEHQVAQFAELSRLRELNGDDGNGSPNASLARRGGLDAEAISAVAAEFTELDAEADADGEATPLSTGWNTAFHSCRGRGDGRGGYGIDSSRASVDVSRYLHTHTRAVCLCTKRMHAHMHLPQVLTHATSSSPHRHPCLAYLHLTHRYLIAQWWVPSSPLAKWLTTFLTALTYHRWVPCSRRARIPLASLILDGKLMINGASEGQEHGSTTERQVRLACPIRSSADLNGSQRISALTARRLAARRLASPFLGVRLTTVATAALAQERCGFGSSRSKPPSNRRSRGGRNSRDVAEQLELTSDLPAGASGGSTATAQWPGARPGCSSIRNRSHVRPGSPRKVRMTPPATGRDSCGEVYESRAPNRGMIRRGASLGTPGTDENESTPRGERSGSALSPPRSGGGSFNDRSDTATPVRRGRQSDDD